MKKWIKESAGKLVNMKRPERKDCLLVMNCLGIENDIKIMKDKAYNQALDDMDAYLPSEEEIADMIPGSNEDDTIQYDVAKAISKRIRE